MSDLFEPNSEMAEREVYLQRILEFVFLNSMENIPETTFGDCEDYRDVCLNNADDNHGIRMAACVGAGVVAALLTGGPGGATWVICAAASGAQWSNDTSACWDNYDICVN